MIGFLSRNAVDIRGVGAAGSRTVGMGIIKQGYHTADTSSTMDTMSFTYFDSPGSTALQTYVLRMIVNQTGNLYVNRTALDSDAVFYERVISTIVLTEIKA